MTDPGILFMVGLEGTRPTRSNLSLLKETGAGAVLLLARNIESVAQTRAFTSELVQRLGRPLLFAVDHEGGWVLRFKSGVTAFPGNAALGALGDESLSRAVGRQMALELRSMGIGCNLAPVLDVVSRYNPGIGIRSFGADPRLAGRLGSAMIRGMQGSGLHACAKHFPGKGAAKVDAHVRLPTIPLTRAELEKAHLPPFRAAVRAGVASVMTSHVRMPVLDRVPATFSRKITHGILRRGLGFDGVIISDDLCMGAVTERMPVQQAAMDTLRAGHDMVIIAHDPGAQRESVELCRAAMEDGGLDKGELRESVRRVKRLLAPRKPADRPSLERGAAIGERIAQGALETVRRGVLRLPLERNGSDVLVLMPDLREVSDRFTFEGGPSGPEEQVRRLCRKLAKVRIQRVPVAGKDVRRIAPAVESAKRIVFLCFEAMRFPGQKEAARLLNRRAAAKTVACTLRNPWDKDLLSPRMTTVDAKGYRASQLGAVLRRVFGAAALALALLSAQPALAQGAKPATIADLHYEYTAASNNEDRKAILAQVSRTAPATTKDIRSLLDLFIRFETTPVRRAVLRSIDLLNPNSRHLSTTILPYLDDTESAVVFFAIRAAGIIRCDGCREKIREIAERRMPGSDPSELLLPSEKHAWATIYEALDALAQWEGPDSFKLIKKKAERCPQVAQVMSRHLWKQSLPVFVEWSKKRKAYRIIAERGLKADVPGPALRETREEMLKILRDRKASRELRHQIAIKVGISSTEEEVAQLVTKYRTETDPETGLMFCTAIFASRSRQAIPILQEFVKKSPDPLARAGALGQLREMIPDAEYRELLGWVSKNETNPDNRRDALDQLQGKTDDALIIVPKP